MKKTLIVGGTFGIKPKQSAIVQNLANLLKADLVNGGTYEDLKNINLKNRNLIIWMANIDNKYEKTLLKKDKGTTLIISKVLRDNVTEIDAISRIFNFRANAVIAINKSNSTFNFKLIDALGNVWSDSDDLNSLKNSILNLKKWSSNSIREKTIQIIDANLYELVKLNTIVADNFEKIKGRYFGNCSTRCSKLFPSVRTENSIFVSRRNVDKNRLTVEDMVKVYKHKTIIYEGNHKPSVDTPVQLALYEKFSQVNYMIHGHTYIENADFTNEYFPCGDMREVNGIGKLIDKKTSGVINLLNHGFLMFSDNLMNLKTLINVSKLIERKIGFEVI